MSSPELTIVPADHPSLDDGIAAFADALRRETRYFGRRGERASRPMPSLVRRLTTRRDLRLAGLVDGEVVALAAIDRNAPDGAELLIAVAEPWRGRGLALTIGRELVALATERGLSRVVLRASYRWSDVRAAGEALGLQSVDLGGGRLAFVRQLDLRSA